MKILHLVKTSVGAPWALRQMQQLVQLGHTVHVALPPGPLVDAYVASGVHVHLAELDFPLKNPVALAQRMMQMRRLVDVVQPELIHSHFVATTLVMRLALGRNHPIPRVFQVPGPLHLEHTLFRQLDLRSAGASDYWIGACQWTCARYRYAGVAPNRVFFSHYSIDVTQTAQRDQRTLRQELVLPDAVRVVGMVAYIYAPKRVLGQRRGLKGHEDLIDALALCLRQDANIVGVFVGGAWDNARWYEEQVRRYGRQQCGDKVFFLGSRDDVASLYADFDLAVHPSIRKILAGRRSRC